jgi:hypothetical protein
LLWQAAVRDIGYVLCRAGGEGTMIGLIDEHCHVKDVIEDAYLAAQVRSTRSCFFFASGV